MIDVLKIKNVKNNTFCNDASASNQTTGVVADNFFNIDKQIDNYSQGKIGDCWLLSGLSAISNSQNGNELLQNAITQNDDGSYNIEFKGIKKTYTITQDEMLEARESGIYSTGDDDVLLMELAFEKAFLDMEENPDKYPCFYYDLIEVEDKERYPLDGGNFSYVTHLLIGKDTHEIRGSRSERLLELFEKNPDDFSICASFRPEDNEVLKITDIYGNEVKLANSNSGHNWAVVCVNDDTVTLVNPWDSESEVVIYKDDFMQSATELSFHDY